MSCRVHSFPYVLGVLRSPKCRREGKDPDLSVTVIFISDSLIPNIFVPVGLYCLIR